MKPVLYVIAAFAVLFVAACGAGTSSGTGAKCDADSTFAQVQQQIFEGQGCTASTCHGDGMQAVSTSGPRMRTRA
jgi:outer membrane biogenesis lipoprotein LolB